jgi:hypothetical protein
LASAGGNGTVRIWQPDTGECVTALRVDGPLTRLAFTSALLAIGGVRGLYLLALKDADQPTP